MIKFKGFSVKSCVKNWALPSNIGISRIINGSQEIRGGYITFRPGIKHIVLDLFYKKQVAKYLRAINEGEIELAASICEQIPKPFRQALMEHVGVTTSFIRGTRAEKASEKLSGIRETFGGFIESIKRKFSRKKPPKITETTVALKPLETKVLPKNPESATEQLEKMIKDNPLSEIAINMRRQDGLTDEQILKIIQARKGISTGDRFYRFIGKSELDALLKGEHVTSTRPCHGGRITDVTTNPDYSKISTQGKYRITFKDKKEFNPFGKGPQRIMEKEVKDGEYHLIGGYSLEDIEKIERKLDDGSFEIVNIEKLLK